MQTGRDSGRVRLDKTALSLRPRCPALLRRERLDEVSLDVLDVLETHRDPHELRIIRKAAKTMQVVVTTHSPELLDAQWITDDNLRIVSWQEGAPHLLPPSEATRQAMRQHLMGAGELLRSNALHADELFTNTDDLHNENLFESLA